MQPNTLYYGDNLDILRRYIPDGSVDLIYLDPPFNSNRAYNVLFKEKSGESSPAQIQAFDDTWQWDLKAEQTFEEIIRRAPENVSEMIDAMRRFIGSNDMMAYLVMMAIRLVELHRVLKPTGSLYLHCDPTASHYLKIVLDTVFGKERLRNEIIWQRTPSKSLASSRLARNHDVIMSYGRGEHATWNVDAVFSRYDPSTLDRNTDQKYSLLDESGRRYQLTSLLNPNADRPNLTYEFLGVTRVWRWTRERMQAAFDSGLIVQPRPGGVPRFKRYLDEQRGKPLTDVWTDIPPINSQAQERLGYPTQKPIELLERIIALSSNPGDIVLDPFCGCGTAIIAAEKLGRNWVGIDITHLAIGVMKSRLAESFPGIKINVIGLPSDLGGARALFDQDPYEFQFWAAGLVNAMPRGGKDKKGADRGIDGIIPFLDGSNRSRREIIVQVKGGKVNSAQIRDLRGTMEREKAEMAIFVTLNPPTSEMRTEAAAAGFYQSEIWAGAFPRIQIATIEDLLKGKLPTMPARMIAGKQAQPIKNAHRHGRQSELELAYDEVDEAPGRMVADG